MTEHHADPQPWKPTGTYPGLYRESVPPIEAARHLNKIAAEAFRQRADARQALRTLLADPDADVYDVNTLLFAQEKARLWRRARARAVGHPEMEGQAGGPVFDPEDGHLVAAVRELRTELRTAQYSSSEEWQEREAVRTFLVYTDFLDR
ncbi:hypothetical protein ACFY4B_27435 [Kitasatospora sp. NPDC001261]|uniref:hypothetical protein n=1 Tax=Kitasatospora sp. NPDC001261 TaxID=3364012 RepID=UPI0036832710